RSAVMDTTPPFWHLLLDKLFHVADRRLSAQLWAALPGKSTTLRWQLALCGQSQHGDETARRIRHLLALLAPRDLLAASERLCPYGRPRPVALRAFEQEILNQLDPTGSWIWQEDYAHGHHVQLG